MLYEINKNKTAVLVIDVQKEYFDQGCNLYTPNAQYAKENIINIVNVAKNNGVKCLFIQHEHKADGSDLGRMGDFDDTPVFEEGTKGVEFIEELPVESEDVIIKKARYNCFVNTELKTYLEKCGIDTVIIVGLMTNYCCLSTAYYAHDIDYKTIYVLDAVQGPDLPDAGYGEVSQELLKKVVATTLLGGIADVVSSADVINELQK